MTRPTVVVPAPGPHVNSGLPFYVRYHPPPGGAKVANSGPRRPGMYSKLGATREGIQKL